MGLSGLGFLPARDDLEGEGLGLWVDLGDLADDGDELVLVLAEGLQDAVSVDWVVLFVQHCAKNNDYDITITQHSHIHNTCMHSCCSPP